MTSAEWHDLGPIDELARTPLRQLVIGRTRIALSCVGGEFAAVSGACNHAGGPLGEGHLDGDYIVCPWHHRDPFDRMLVAQAMVEGLTVVTRDPKFQRYDVKVLKA